MDPSSAGTAGPTGVSAPLVELTEKPDTVELIAFTTYTNCKLGVTGTGCMGIVPEPQLDSIAPDSRQPRQTFAFVAFIQISQLWVITAAGAKKGVRRGCDARCGVWLNHFVLVLWLIRLEGRAGDAMAA